MPKSCRSRSIFPRLESLERWIALLVLVVVALGATGETYQQYSFDRANENVHFLGLDYENWGDFLVNDPEYGERAETDDRYMRYVSYDDFDDALEQALAEGVDFGAYRFYAADLYNPETHQTIQMPLGIERIESVAATFGIDWEEYGLLDSGRAPAASGEIAVSNDVAQILEVSIGDTIEGSHSEGEGTFEFMVVGLLKDDFSWTLGNSPYLFTQSGRYGALVAWEDSEDLATVLQTWPKTAWTETYWNGESPTLEQLAPSRGGANMEDSESDYGWWLPGARLIVETALLIGLVSVLLVLAIGHRAEQDKRGWKLLPRLAVIGAASAAMGLATGLALSYLVNVFFDLRYSQLIQIPFALPPTSRLAIWLAAGVGLTLLLGLASRLRGSVSERRMPSFRRAGVWIGRVLKPRWWTLAFLLLALAVVSAWPWIDDSMTWVGARPPGLYRWLLLILLPVCAVYLCALFPKWFRPSVDSPDEELGSTGLGIAVIVAAVVTCLTLPPLAMRITLEAKLEQDCLVFCGWGVYDFNTGTIVKYSVVAAITTYVGLSLARRVSNRMEQPPARSVVLGSMLVVAVAVLFVCVVSAVVQYPIGWRDTVSFFDIPDHSAAWVRDTSWYVGGRILAVTGWVTASAGLAALIHSRPWPLFRRSG